MKKNMHLLLVDDDSEDRLLFVEALKQVDKTIRCTELSNGEQALAHLEELRNELPDYIFLDLRMPRVSGKTCLTEIKKNDRLKNIPVFIYTTSRDVEESKALKDVGAFHFISKPNNADEIYYLLSSALQD